MNIEPGHVIDGKYRIVRLLGTGGMGAVYEGENVRIRRKVAIKLLHGNVSSQAEAVQRFEREAQAAGRIGSEHICEVLDLGVLADGTRYMVMEYLEGENMSGRIQRAGRLGPTQSVPLMVQVLDALSAAHAAGIIHRDLKPDNIWITPQKGGIKDFVKILDFGVSKFSQLGGEESMNVTRAGAVVGTPYYMSPEQARGMSQVDQRTDIYAIGVLLYQATTGQVPYQAETFNELLFKIVLEPPPPPNTYVPDLDPDFASIIARAMAREPGQRFQTCNEFREALVGYQTRLERRGGAPAPAPPAAAGGGGGTMMLDTNQVMAAVGAAGGAQPWASASGTARAPSGANWGTASSQNAALAAAAAAPNAAPQTPTANSWGNASGAESVAIPKKSAAGLWVAVIGAAVVLGGGGVAAIMLLGKSGPANAAGKETGAQTAQPTAKPTPPPPTETAATPPPPPTSDPTPPATVATPEPTATTPDKPGTKPASTTAKTNPKTPKGTPSTTPSTGSKTPPAKTANPGDLGY